MPGAPLTPLADKHTALSSADLIRILDDARRRTLELVADLQLI